MTNSSIFVCSMKNLGIKIALLNITRISKNFLFLFIFALFSLSSLPHSNSVKLIPPAGPETFYPGITSAYSAIPLPVTGNYLIEIQNNYDGTDPSEIYPISLTDKGLSVGGYSITIRPAADNNTAIIQRPVASAGAVVQFNGGDNIILDGRPGSV